MLHNSVASLQQPDGTEHFLDALGRSWLTRTAGGEAVHSTYGNDGTPSTEAGTGAQNQDGTVAFTHDGTVDTFGPDGILERRLLSDGRVLGYDTAGTSVVWTIATNGVREDYLAMAPSAPATATPP